MIPTPGASAVAEGGKRAVSIPLNTQALVERFGRSKGEQISASTRCMILCMILWDCFQDTYKFIFLLN